jgi:glycosyltransferase involved in cell wall biosynthesis
MKKVCICGHFGFGENLLNGQTIKTKIVTDELESQFGQNEVVKIDTHGGIKQMLCAVMNVIKAEFTCRNIIIMPAHNGVRVFSPILAFFKTFSPCKLHYVVIGGWLPELIESKSFMKKCLKRFDDIYVETSTMQKALERQGFFNIIVMPNCKKINVLTEKELVYCEKEPYPLCTFSRVMKEKGIEDAIDAVKIVNKNLERVVFTLDIFGQIDSGYADRFQCLNETFPNFIKYGGMVPFDQSVEVLKRYFALLFPTRFYTEGVPGTIIDAYAAGIPVIASRWESFHDIVDNDITGVGYEFNDQPNLIRILFQIANESTQMNCMKIACLKAGARYLPCNVLYQLLENLR